MRFSQKVPLHTWLSPSSLYGVIQDERSVLLEVIVSVIVRKNVIWTRVIILNGYRDRAVWVSRPNAVTFLFIWLGEWRSLQNIGGYTRRIARSHFGCSCQHKETLRSTETTTSKQSFAHEFQSALRWTVGFFRALIENCNKSVINWEL